MLLRSTLLLAALALAPAALSAADPTLTGDWKTTDGSIVRVYPCASALCMKVVFIRPSAPGTHDENNPNPSLRSRSLCNLEIGSGFVPSGNSAATGGNLYDPESGKTYKGNIDLKGGQLKLRGYIGIALIGRTEYWNRISDVKPCS